MTIATLALLSRLFDKTDYATYRQTLLIYTFAAPCLTLGLSGAMMFFISRNPTRSREILCNAFASLGVTGALFVAFTAFIAPLWLPEGFSNPALIDTLPWIGLYGLGTIFSSLLAHSLLAHERILVAASATIGMKLFVFASVVAAVYLIPTPSAVIATQSIAAAMVGAASALLALHLANGPSELPKLSVMAHQLAFAVPLGLGVIIETLAMGLDGILVSALCSPDEFATFSNGAMEIPLIGMITGAATAVMLPEIVRNFRDQNAHKAHQLWQRTAVKSARILFPVGGGLFLFAPELMTLLFSEQYRASATPFRFYLLLLPARIALFGAIFQAANRTDLILKRSIGTLLLNLLLSYPLILFFGINGAAIGTVLVFWLYVIPYCTKFVSRVLGVRLVHTFPLKVLSVIALSTILAMAVTVVALTVLRPESSTSKIVALTIYLISVAAADRVLAKGNRFATAVASQEARMPAASCGCGRTAVPIRTY